ncbi:S8 family serine peptidase [Aquimarina sp. ERC-38]|uniref:S8 family serine peptidase n=1 Tax=Aquimarina sp. ERC-38 TaxID=2949996 RepID=UPI00224582E9|nr:S8 family serine peptidase [Aquimarina sp. ERC-38]UZO80471.1 S8 family serine peptidase [Aquimarina sp. ERC-38]
MKKFILLVLFCYSSLSFAQVEDAWIYFQDKPNVQDALARPLSILTQKAIDRKARHNTPIDQRDVPVNEKYVATIKNSAGITYLAKSKWFNCVYVRGELDAIQELANLTFVESIDYADNSLDDGMVKKPVITKKNDQYDKFKLEKKANFDYATSEAQTLQIGVDQLHKQGYTGKGITIAVMDSGFPGVATNSVFEQARTEGRLLESYDFVNRSTDALTGNSHGAHTFSTIAGFVNGQFVGTAPNASYHLFITEDGPTEGPMEESLWVEAAERADSLGVDVINTSLGYSNGFDNPAYNYTPSDMDGETTFISRGANIAFAKGMLVVVSAGNSGGNNWGIITAPADAPGAFSIGAVTGSGNRSGFSSTGPTADNRIKPDVVARGSATTIVRANGDPGVSSGTSFSSPIIAGAVASLWEAFPDKTNAEIMQLVRASASQFANPDNRLGYGIPNFGSIVETLNTVTNEVASLSLYPNPVKDIIYISNPIKNQVKASIYASDGRLVKKVSFTNKESILLSDLTSGLYMIKIEGASQFYQTKFIKQ